MEDNATEKSLETPRPLWRRTVEGLLVILGVSEWVTYQKVMNNVMFFLLLVGIGVLQVMNSLSAERMNRSINKKQQEVKELRWEYMTIKSDMMYRSMPSELSKLLLPTGVKELSVPPKTIIVPKNEY